LINKRKLHTSLFVLSDAFVAALSWTLFFAYRKFIIEPDKFGYKIPLELDNERLIIPDEERLTLIKYVSLAIQLADAHTLESKDADVIDGCETKSFTNLELSM
jgi:hypothetical protein